MPSNMVCGLGQGKNGDIWCSTFNGLCRLNDPERKIVNYFFGNGLVDKEYLKSVYFQRECGNIYWGGYGRGISNGAVGVSLAIKGFYAGVMGWPSSHENDMGVDKWSDKTTTVVHIGYQIPIVKNLRFIPVIGYAKIAYGTTDGSDYTISDSGIVHNKFSEKKVFRG